MSLNEEFDELARRKLEERQVAFQEADWQAARKLIDAERGGRKRGAWITGAVVLLLIGGLAWYGAGSSEKHEAVAAIERTELRPAELTTPERPLQNTSATASGTIPKAKGPAAATELEAPSIQSIPVPTVERTTTAPTAASGTAVKSTTWKGVGSNSTNGDQPKAIPSRKKVAHTEHSIRSEVKTSEALSPSETMGSAPGTQAATRALAESGKGSDQTGIIYPAGKAVLRHSIGSTVTSTTVADQPDMPIVHSVTNQSDDERIATEVPAPHGDTSSKVASTFMVTAEVPVRSQAGTASSFSDTTTVDATSATLPEDTATAAVPVATPPPLVPARAPWEVSIMGGMFSSSTKYTGSNSAEWNADIGKANSIGISAELMHMGRNFGIGAGLHYSTYAERLKTTALDRNSTSLENYWYLIPVDTMVLVITDTLPGTPPTYTGTSTNTTVNVLAQGTDTTITTERIREARNEVNRVSYLEVPLLLDGHLVQGRWSFGLLGGPTIGLLTGRRGAVPAQDNEGYVVFADQPFRELTFGYTARAYLRYRFNAAWSVGIEPALRGQLMNSLGSGELQRRASAKGVMLSLSYRLR